MSKVRVSVANLATRLIDEDSGTIYHFGIKPKNKIQALGGAVELTPQGVELFTYLGASSFEIDIKTGHTDARFLIETDKVEDVFGLFAVNGEQVDPRWEMDPIGDIMAELTGKQWPNACCILPQSLSGFVELRWRTFVRQMPPESGKGTSAREKESIPTRRMFRLWDIYAEKWVIGVILEHPLVWGLSIDELATTRGGACKGVTMDGIEIADNLFLVP